MLKADFSENKGVVLFYVIAISLLIIGLGGIVWIVYLSLGG